MSARLDRAAIIAANPIFDYCRSHGLELRREGREWVRCCPLHEERTPSFKINPEKQVFHCHGCDAGGSVIDLHAALRGITIEEAMRELSGNQQQQRPREVAKYVYRDEDGYPLFEVVRFFPKNFWQFRLDEKVSASGRAGWATRAASRIVYPKCSSQRRSSSSRARKTPTSLSSRRDASRPAILGARRSGAQSMPDT